MKLIHPLGCRYCGEVSKDHRVKLFHERHGWHNYVRPTQQQVKIREDAIRYIGSDDD